MAKRLEIIIKEGVDIGKITKAIRAEGYKTQAKHKIRIKQGLGKDINFLELMCSPKRIEKLTDGWLLDHFLSRIYGKDFTWSPSSLDKHIPWREAEEYAKQFGMQPSDFELSTLIDRSKRNPAIIEAAKILDLKTDDWYWSRTPLAGNSDYAWFVDFEDGGMYYSIEASNYYVRPVRSSQ